MRRWQVAVRSARKLRARENEGETAGGVDAAGHTKQELRRTRRAARHLGRSSMTKHELGQAIARVQD